MSDYIWRTLARPDLATGCPGLVIAGADVLNPEAERWLTITGHLGHASSHLSTEMKTLDIGIDRLIEKETRKQK